ncbi:hypothetical protein AC579_1772 [Pseudocercospora musae]|uniref:PHD-type domain-containing protein n=1 Tax=Pseudocercospora musae TaxID=113226 RepID=A0A139IP53_9PEZI|nr:hypothetical protein AC579_1772 [Pseudocercospora musae]
MPPAVPFHFDARGDSSDEDTAGIDLAAWQSAAVAPNARPSDAAPVAQMIAPDAEVIESAASPESAELEPGRKRKRISPSQSPVEVGSGFQAINSRRESQRSTYNLDSHVTPEAEADPSPMFVGEEEEPPRRNGKGDNAARGLFVHIPEKEVARALKKQWEDFTTGGDRVRRVLRERYDEDGTVLYKVQFDDYRNEEVAFNDLLDFDNGQDALADFQENPPSESEVEITKKRKGPRGPRKKRNSNMVSTRTGRRQVQQAGFVSTTDFVDGSDVEMSDDEDLSAKFAGRRRRRQDMTQYQDDGEPEDDDEEDEGSEDELARGTRTRRRSAKTAASAKPTRSLRARRKSTGLTESEEDVDSDGVPFLQSDLPGQRKRKSKPRSRTKGADYEEDGIGFTKSTRQSGRTTRHQGGMQEVEMDDIYRLDSDSERRQPVKPKILTTKEVFKELPRNNEFCIRHYQYCESCGQGSSFSKLIYCQGCSVVYHKQCLGHRTNREHLVTKVGEDNFVLQCRRCVGFPRRKDATAPDQGKCSGCYRHGSACRPWRPRKTPSQEQRDRDENDGVDPSYPIPSEMINNMDNVMFRCTNCFRGWHFEHLPSRADYDTIETDVDPEQRYREYSRDWKCKDCAEMPAKVSGIIAWKPVDEDAYDPALGLEGMDEEDIIYLVKWDQMSYFRARWMPGPWVWGVTAPMMRKAFAKRDDSQHPKMRTEDAIPEDYLRTDIVLNVKYTSYVDIRTEDIDKARIREIEKALIKYKGLTYEDAVWETPPGPEDGERWSDFVMAYNDWVAGRYVRQPRPNTLKTRLEKARKEDFRNLEKTQQPESMEGGKLMEYQIQGLNWLYYKWFTQKNAILADEMGLGKTIQIIGFLATMVQDHSCYPFLVVVPNSTCPNWRREIKRWAPNLRVVAYYGSKESRDMAYKYELYPEQSKDLRCHVVVTSYDAAADENCRKFFRGVPWQGLIVDEGQRLKNDKNLLYAALSALKAPFKILLTGTPLQNNQRELFNLLHFLDDEFDAAALEQEYEELDASKIAALHEMIRPFFLRRTKAQVLTFLPPMAQLIVPVSMSVVQKKLYRSILAKNPDLMKAIFSTESTNLKQGERASLSNILMQLRKCLCHPFVYNKSIEDRQVDLASSHRNLVDASSKLKLLELLLPKLKERGHRVLIFSQFLEMLDMVEDFMDGMQLRYQRLDGSISALQKQKRIDEFNAPDSPLFGFLLSTRAGGVGINLATADTVIILDPDFNPHQDIQALSRAHRIGQQKKVLCFQLITRASAEERIMQIGRKKLALDHVLIQEMDADDADQTDLVSVLRHGAAELFEDSGEKDIVFDSYSVDRLLDRSHMEDTKTGEDKSAETQFSIARVWANDSATLQDAVVDSEESAPDPGVWANILKERERVAAEEAAAKAEAFGRGRRARAANVDYTGEGDELEGVTGEAITPLRKRKKRDPHDSDTDFQADDSEDDAEDEGEQVMENGELMDLNKSITKEGPGKQKKGKQKSPLPTPAATPAKPKATPKKASTTQPPQKKQKTAPKPRASSKVQSKTYEKVPPKSAALQPMKKSGDKGDAAKEESPEKEASASTAKKGPKGVAKQAGKAQKSPESNTRETQDAKSQSAEPPAADQSAVQAAPSESADASAPSSPMREGGVTTVEKSLSSTPQNGSTVATAIVIDSDDDSEYHNIPTFKRAVIPHTKPGDEAMPVASTTGDQALPPKEQDIDAAVDKRYINCRACVRRHEVGSCPLKIAGVEHCNLCGIAHFGQARVCPHIQSETQVRQMIEALKYSNEPEHLVNEARRYLRGLKGNLVQLKKQKELKQQQAQYGGVGPSMQQNSWAPQPQPQGTAYGVPAWSAVGGNHGHM